MQDASNKIAPTISRRRSEAIENISSVVLAEGSLLSFVGNDTKIPKKAIPHVGTLVRIISIS
jgi:hypothetical protein